MIADMMLISPDEKEHLLKRIEKIDQMRRGDAKYRAIGKLLWDINPECRAEFVKTAIQVKEKRENLTNKFGFSKTMDTRHAMSLPVPLLNALYTFDPELKLLIEDKDRNIRKRTARSLANAFPEFKIA